MPSKFKLRHYLLIGGQLISRNDMSDPERKCGEPLIRSPRRRSQENVDDTVRSSAFGVLRLIAQVELGRLLAVFRIGPGKKPAAYPILAFSRTDRVYYSVNQEDTT